MVFNPDPDDTFNESDVLVVMGKRVDVEAFQKSQGLACEDEDPPRAAEA